MNRALEINSDSTNLWKKSLELNALNGKQERVRISSNRLVELGNSKSDIFIHLIDFFIEKKVWVKAYEFAEEAVS